MKSQTMLSKNPFQDKFKPRNLNHSEFKRPSKSFQKILTLNCAKRIKRTFCFQTSQGHSSDCKMTIGRPSGSLWIPMDPHCVFSAFHALNHFIDHVVQNDVSNSVKSCIQTDSKKQKIAALQKRQNDISHILSPSGNVSPM